MVELVKTSGNAVVVKLNVDRATMANVENFKTSISEIVDKYTKVIIDLSPVSFVDSVFLGAFVVVLKRLSAKNGELVLTGLQPSVQKLFEMTRMDNIIIIKTSVEEAI